MSKLIYDVSVSIDGYISGPDGDVSQYPHSSPMVDDYFERLSGYTIAVMGRATYEFGYAFGLKAGANPYPNMRSIVLSRSITLPDDTAVEIIRTEACEFVRDLKKDETGSIYLCGGGALAGSLARAGLIDELHLKRPHILLGGGTRLFGEDGASLRLSQIHHTDYSDGSLYQAFTVTRS